MSSREDFRVAQKRQILEYLAKIQLKELFRKLSYEVTLFRPNDPIQYWIDRLVELGKDPDAPEPQRPQVIFVVGPPQSGKTSFAKHMCSTYDMFYISLEQLIKNEIYFQTPIGKKLSALIDEDKKKRQGASSVALTDVVPLDLQIDLLKKEIEDNADEVDFVIDGFPTTVKAALLFEERIIECRFLALLSPDGSESGASEPEEEEGETQVPSASSSDPAAAVREQLEKRIDTNADGDDYQKAAKRKLFGSLFDRFEKDHVAVREYFLGLNKLKLFDATMKAEERNAVLKGILV